VRLEGLRKLKKSDDLIGSRTRDLPACIIVPLLVCIQYIYIYIYICVYTIYIYVYSVTSLVSILQRLDHVAWVTVTVVPKILLIKNFPPVYTVYLWETFSSPFFNFYSASSTLSVPAWGGVWLMRLDVSRKWVSEGPVCCILMPVCTIWGRHGHRTVQIIWSIMYTLTCYGTKGGRI
jgi:hypothetical protein